VPRLFLAVATEDRTPVIDILQQTPSLPDHCQWQFFLRNHDDLSLEMVTAVEREAMYAAYASDPLMKKNVGIRRRLAPLLENDQRKIELFHGLLLSLPGSPMLYYGDEIGMGDNIYLQDRDSVRTPMQWSDERNGGFSRADFAQLYLPPVQNSVYGIQAVNVEAQLRYPSSLLHCLRGLLDIRRQYASVFGTGHFEILQVENPAILAYIRAVGDTILLCVHNLSRSPQPIELPLPAFRGLTPVELSRRVLFPPIGELPYLLTLTPYGFFWFQLVEL
jgi:maltose alpha-D-glucosyltransferase/alpha-amylase